MKISWKNITVVIVACLVTAVFTFTVAAKSARVENVPVTLTDQSAPIAAAPAVTGAYPGVPYGRGAFLTNLYAALGQPTADVKLAVLQAQVEWREAIIKLRNDGRRQLGRILNAKQIARFDEQSVGNRYRLGVRVALTDPTLTEAQRSEVNALGLRKSAELTELRRQFLARVIAIRAKAGPPVIPPVTEKAPQPVP